VDPESERQQVERLKSFKAGRDAAAVEQRLEEIRAASRGTDNMLPVLREALKERCTLGEVCGAMRDVFGEYQPTF
jgi:methylmalonyl-CoA mutase N-terminal domain/subunit